MTLPQSPGAEINDSCDSGTETMTFGDCDMIPKISTVIFVHFKLFI